MKLPDVSNDLKEWERLPTRTSLWKNKLYPEVFSTNGGTTFTISTERYDPNLPRPIHKSRTV